MTDNRFCRGKIDNATRRYNVCIFHVHNATRPNQAATGQPATHPVCKFTAHPPPRGQAFLLRTLQRSRLARMIMADIGQQLSYRQRRVVTGRQSLVPRRLWRWGCLGTSQNRPQEAHFENFQGQAWEAAIA